MAVRSGTSTSLNAPCPRELPGSYTDPRKGWIRASSPDSLETKRAAANCMRGIIGVLTAERSRLEAGRARRRDSMAVGRGELGNGLKKRSKSCLWERGGIGRTGAEAETASVI
jgi:hypothetical protein